MIRRNHYLAKSISVQRPEFCHYHSYLFLNNYKLFLRGFALDLPNGGCYVWKYIFPLFTNLEFISLTFGYRIEEGYVDFSKISSSQILPAVLSIIDRNSDFAKEESVAEFLSFVDDRRITRETKEEAIILTEALNETGVNQLTDIIKSNKNIYGIE